MLYVAALELEDPNPPPQPVNAVMAPKDASAKTPHIARLTRRLGINSNPMKARVGGIKGQSNPPAIVLPVWMVRVELADALPGVTETGLKLAVAPAGRPVAESVTTPEKTPFCGVTAMEYVAMPPCVTVWVGFVVVTANVGVALPVPLSAIRWGEPNALSATLKVPLKLAAEAGVKVTERTQLEPGARDAPHVFVCANADGLAPPIVIPVIVRGALPVFDRVDVCATLVAPMVALKLRLAGVNETAGANATVPVPLRLTMCGEAFALSATESSAVKFPAADGVNVTDMKQLPPAANEPLQVFVWVKLDGFAPTIETPLIVSAALPMFDKVDTWEALKMPGIEAKVNETGVRDTTGAKAAVPVPFRVTDCVAMLSFARIVIVLPLPTLIVDSTFGALSVTLRVAVKLATEDGRNVTEILQLAPAARVLPQVLAWAKAVEFAPVIVIPLIESTALPLFVSVAFCAVLVVPLAAVKVSVPGTKTAPGCSAAVTLTDATVDVLPLLLLSPPYTAVTVWTPNARDAVVSVATPPLTTPVPSVDEASIKVTVPLALTVPEVGTTVAVNVTLLPTVILFALAWSVVVVAAWILLTTTLFDPAELLYVEAPVLSGV
jgi:hypothetical protein